jgi:hypothetical protein
MPIPELDLVQRVLTANDRDLRCRDAVETAFRTVRNMPDIAWWRRKTTARELVWEHSVNNAIAAFEGDAGVHPVSHFDTTSFVFDDVVLARFKKAEINLHTSNYPTLLARMFHRHENEDLFGFSGHHRVEIAHVTNRFGTELEWLGVVARERNQVLWSFELRRGGATNVTPFPAMAPTAPAADRVLHPVKPDTGKVRDEKDGPESE